MRDRPLLSERAKKTISEGPSKPGYPLVLVGGFPCQDLSIAGRGAGLSGKRSGLWKEFKRAITCIRPDWVVVENVGHTWRRWVPDVRSELAGLGYASLSLRVRASDLGALHQRARIFIISNADCELLRELSRWWLGPGRQMAKELGQSWDWTPGTTGAYDGLSGRMDRNRAIGNAIVPQIAQIIARGIKEVTSRPTEHCYRCSAEVIGAVCSKCKACQVCGHLVRGPKCVFCDYFESRGEPIPRQVDIEDYLDSL